MVTAPSSPLLEIEGVCVRFGGVVALDGVSFDVQPGQICGLIGPNGAGKSTLFNCLSRLYKCSEGSIRFDGQILGSLPRHRMAGLGIGRTFQNLALFRSMTVLENVLVGTHAHQDAGFAGNLLRLPRAAGLERAARARASAVIDQLGLQAHASRQVTELTFAEQKMVELARALACAPRLLLLDEPACGLNHEEAQLLKQRIRRLRDETGLTILLVEHHMGLVMDLCEHVVVLNFGRKIAEGTPAQVQEDAGVISAYLGADEDEGVPVGHDA